MGYFGFLLMRLVGQPYKDCLDFEWVRSYGIFEVIGTNKNLMS